jgi:molybdopterin/thiamine biosynthesis adenylyltransferase
MISIAAETVDRLWSALKSGSAVQIVLSVWDNGDAYIDNSLSPIGPNTVIAALVIGDADAKDASVTIRLRNTSPDTAPQAYTAPDGTLFQAIGSIRTNGAESMSAVKIERVRTNLALRRAGILETEVLSTRSVCIVGLGTGGAAVSLDLAKAGVGSFLLFDADRIEVGNVTRHQAGVSSVGRLKVNAVRDLILEKNPYATVGTHAFRVDASNREQVLRVFADADLVVCATDSRQSKLLVNEMCIESNTPAVFGGAFRRAYGGQVLRVRPNTSACYHCFVMAVPEKESDREIASAEAAEAVAYSDRPVLIEPGLSIDVAPISTMVAKLAVQELIQGEQSALHILDRDLEAPWYLWINRPEPGTDYASWPPLSESTDEMTILRWYGIHLERESGCPTCGNFGQTLRAEYRLTDIASGAPEARPFPPTAGNKR